MHGSRKVPLAIGLLVVINYNVPNYIRDSTKSQLQLEAHHNTQYAWMKAAVTVAILIFLNLLICD